VTRIFLLQTLGGGNTSSPFPDLGNGEGLVSVVSDLLIPLRTLRSPSDSPRPDRGERQSRVVEVEPPPVDVPELTLLPLGDDGLDVDFWIIVTDNRAVDEVAKERICMSKSGGEDDLVDAIESRLRRVIWPSLIEVVESSAPNSTISGMISAPG